MKKELLSTVQLLCGSFTCVFHMWKFYHKLSYYPKYKTLIFVFITLNMLQLEFTFSNRHWSIDFHDLLRQHSQTGISLQYCYNCVFRQSTHFSIIKWEKIAFHGLFWRMSVLGVLFLCKFFFAQIHINSYQKFIQTFLVAI